MHNFRSIEEIEPNKGQLLLLSYQIGGTDVFKYKGVRVIRNDLNEYPASRAKLTAMYTNADETDLVESGNIEMDTIGKYFVGTLTRQEAIARLKNR